MKLKKTTTLVGELGDRQILLTQKTNSPFNTFTKNGCYMLRGSAEKSIIYRQNNFSGLTDSELGKFIRLSQFLNTSNLFGYNAQPLDYNKKSKSELFPYKKSQLANICDITRDTFNTLWKKLEQLKIVRSVVLDGKNFWACNPLFVNSCKYIPLFLFNLFKDELITEIPEWAVQSYARQTYYHMHKGEFERWTAEEKIEVEQQVEFLASVEIKEYSCENGEQNGNGKIYCNTRDCQCCYLDFDTGEVCKDFKKTSKEH